MKKLKVALIGMGRMGKIHFRHLGQFIPQVSLVAVADTFYEPVAGEFGNIFFTKNPEEVIERDDVEAVVICTPTSTHARLVDTALENDKHVFCEKPLDLSLDITSDLTSKAKQAKTKLMLGFNRRFDPDFMQAKKSVVEGKIGKLQIIKITNRDPGLPSMEFIKTSGGMFMDFTIHDFDMARFIMQKNVSEVFAKGLVFVDDAVGEAGDIDTALITLTFEDGTYALIDNSRKAVYGYDQRMEIFGSDGMIQVENNLYTRNIIYDAEGIHQALPLHSFTERYIGSYLKEMESFVDAVVNNKPVPVNSDDNLSATILAYAAKKSMQEGRPVKLSEIAIKQEKAISRQQVL